MARVWNIATAPSASHANSSDGLARKLSDRAKSARCRRRKQFASQLLTDPPGVRTLFVVRACPNHSANKALVYFIHYRPKDLVKIGVSCDIQQRRRGLRNALPVLSSRGHKAWKEPRRLPGEWEYQRRARAARERSRLVQHKDLHVLATVHGGYRMEGELHRRFADLRVSGEWFRCEEPIVKYLAAIGCEPCEGCRLFATARPTLQEIVDDATRTAVGDALIEFRTNSAAARALNVSRSYFIGLRRRFGFT